MRGVSKYVSILNCDLSKIRLGPDPDLPISNESVGRVWREDFSVT